MSKQLGYKLMGILLFIASGIITIMYTLSNVMGIIPCTVALIQGIGIESAKTFFSYITITTNSKDIVKKFMFGTLAVTALIISIVATTGFSINMSNTVKDYLMKKSDQYKNSQKFVATQGDLYEVTKKQLDDLKSQRDTQIAGMEKTRDQWGKNYKTQKSIEQDKINATASKFNSEIASKEVELKATAGTLNQKTEEQTNTQGYEALYTTLAKFVNEAKQEQTAPKTTTGDEVSFWMNLFVAVALEFFGIGFIFLSMGEESHVAIKTPLSQKTDNSHIGFKPTIVTAHTNSHDGIHDNTDTFLIGDFAHEDKPTRIIGFNRDNTSASAPTDKNNGMVESPAYSETTNVQADSTINQGDLKIYLDYMYLTAKNNISTGYMSISKNTGLTIEGCRKIKGHLERLGVIRTDGARTVILQDNWQS